MWVCARDKCGWGQRFPTRGSRERDREREETLFWDVGPSPDPLGKSLVTHLYVRLRISDILLSTIVMEDTHSLLLQLLA